MAIGWLTVLKSVPWVEVVAAAPKVAEGAKRLWNAATTRSVPVAGASTGITPNLSPGTDAISGMESRLSGLEGAVLDLQSRMIESSGLIKALADQNTQLIDRIESMRIRALWLAAAVFASGLVAAVSLVFTLIH